MKNLKSLLVALSLAVSFAVLFASCSTARKVANEQSQQRITSSTTTDEQTQTNKVEAIEVRKTETDLSNIVIDFTKVEYCDGTVELTTTESEVPTTDAVKQRDREETEPPNVGRKVKSVTSGRVTINNDKKTQTDTDVTKEDNSQTSSSVQSDEQTEIETSVKTEEKEKHGFFYYFGIFACVLLASFIIYKVGRFFRRNKIL